MNHPQRVLAFALLATSAAAFAQQGTNTPPPASNPTPNPTLNDPPRDATTPRTTTGATTLPMKSFEEYDTNGDGTISAAEFSPASAKGMTLAQIDKNGDGRVSRDEWNAQKQRPKDDMQRK